MSKRLSEKKQLAYELLYLSLVGKQLRIIDSKISQQIGLKGTLIYESANFFHILTKKGQIKRIFKENVTLQMQHCGKTLNMDGRLLLSTLQTRIKKMKWVESFSLKLFTVAKYEKMANSVGYNIDYKPEKVSEDDNKCPYYGKTSVRGKMFEGTVISDDMSRTVKVSWTIAVKNKKYNRYEYKRSKVSAHNPDCIGAKKGDRVLIGETKPLSKTKHFTVLKILKENEIDKKE